MTAINDGCRADKRKARAEVIPIEDLPERLARAERSLRDLAAAQQSAHERYRLEGKAEGVALALSYVEEMTR